MAQDSDLRPDSIFDLRLAEINRKQQQFLGRKQLWHAHHWPEDYSERCVRVGSRHVCRRCAALYPLGFLVAFLAAFGYPLWPTGWDPAAIWILSIPGTVAFVGTAIGLFDYSPRWQVAATLLAAMAFGRGLGYELVERWSPEFWQPIAVFGGIWFLRFPVRRDHPLNLEPLRDPRVAASSRCPSLR